MSTLFVQEHKPKHPFATDYFRDGVKVYKKEEAYTKRYVETAPKAYKNVVALDFDIKNASEKILEMMEERIIPVPNVVTENPKTTHAHALYFLEYGASSEKTQAMLTSVQKKLATVSGADLAFAGKFTYNPLVMPSDTLSRRLTSLSELSKYVEGVKVQKRSGIKAEDLMELQELREITGRNYAIFEHLRIFAYKVYSELKSSPGSFYLALLEKGAELNEQFEGDKLKTSELDEIIESIHKFCERNFTQHSKKFIETQKYRNKLSRAKATEKKMEKIFLVEQYLAAGVSMKDACEALNINYSSFRVTYSKHKKGK